MNVRELIDALSHYPPDRPVVVRGYEDGWDNPNIRERDVLWNHNVGPDGKKLTWYDGQHSRPEDAPADTTRTTVVVIE